MTTAMTPHTGSMLPSHDETERYWKLAQRVASTEMVPRAYRGKADAVLAVSIAGRELGLGPMEALRSFDVIDGKPAPSAQLAHTLALRAGHDIAVVETTSERSVVRCRRAEWPQGRHVDIDFTMDDAKTAGLAGKQNWQKYPRAMLRNRAITEAIRAVCPDVLVGATYTAEELGASDTDADGRIDDGQWVDQVAEVEVIPDPAPAAPPADDDTVDAEIVDDDEDAPTVEAQRAAEFDEILGRFPDQFVAWLVEAEKLDAAAQLAIGSDDGLVRVEKRLGELHDWWTSQQTAAAPTGAEQEEPSW